MISAVIFDIGNVLIEWNPARFYDLQIGPARRKRLFDSVPLAAMNDRVDLGAPMSEEVAALARAHPAWAEEIALWHSGWVEMASPEIPHSVRLLRALRARGLPVFALSNFGVETFALAETLYPFLGEFDRRYISGQLGVMKPDPVIYGLVETDCALPPESLLFTDDRADNIAAAAARGWATHLFTGADGLAARLVAEGLLSAEEAR